MINIENYVIQWLNHNYSRDTYLNWVISYNYIFISHRSIIGGMTHYYEHTFSNTGISLVQPPDGCNSTIFSLGI